MKINLPETLQYKMLRDLAERLAKPKSQIVVNEYLVAIVTLTNNNI
jgi:hypothetical protein